MDPHCFTHTYMRGMVSKMNCHQIKELFSEYASGSLPRGLSESARDHFLECSECRDAYSAYTSTMKALDEMVDIKPPSNLHQLIMNRVAESQVPVRVSIWEKLKMPFQLQHKALATGFALLAVFGIINGFYPVKPALSSLVQTNKAIGSSVAPSLVASGVTWKTGTAVNAGISMAYSPNAAGALAIKLQSTAQENTHYSVVFLTRGQTKQGIIEQGKSSVIQIAPADGQTAVARVDWIHKGITYTRNIFVPAKMDNMGSGKQIDLTVASGNMVETLRTIASAYGVAIVVSGDMTALVPGTNIMHGSPDAALYNTVAKAGYTWRQLDNSVYYIEPNA